MKLISIPFSNIIPFRKEVKKGPDAFSTSHVCCLISPSVYTGKNERNSRMTPCLSPRADGIRAVCTDKGTGEAQWTVPVFHPSATSVRFLVSVYSTITGQRSAVSSSLLPHFSPERSSPCTVETSSTISTKRHVLRLFSSMAKTPNWRQQNAFHSRLVTHIDAPRFLSALSLIYHVHIQTKRERERERERERDVKEGGNSLPQKK